MKYGIPIFLLIFCAVLPRPAGGEEPPRPESSVESYRDYVKIRYMPSRSDFMKKVPVTELTGETSTIVAKHDGSVMGTNEDIKSLYERAKALSDQGTVSNQRHFHVTTITLEVAYRGDTVSLDFAGPSGEDNYAAYERAWQELYADAYRFLTRRIQPAEE